MHLRWLENWDGQGKRSDFNKAWETSKEREEVVSKMSASERSKRRL